MGHAVIEPDIPYGDAMLRVRADPKGGFRGIVVGRANEPRQHPTRAGLLAELQAMVRAADPLFVGIEGARRRFLAAFLGGFADPAYGGDGEGGSKRALAARLAATLPLAEARAPDAAARAVKLLQGQDLLNWQDMARLAVTLRGKGGGVILPALADLAEGHATALDRLGRFGPADGVIWSTVTYLPFLWRPDRNLLLKPDFCLTYARCVGHRFALDYDPALAPGVYGALMEMAGETLAAVADLGARDMIDAHSFMWTAVRYPAPREYGAPGVGGAP